MVEYFKCVVTVLKLTKNSKGVAVFIVFFFSHNNAFLVSSQRSSL